ncbi:MAG TPA: ABC transporter substrate-binding protein [Burkholderiales bacterium]|nr:ABC transporter substrate-binding protein [Burkholderiales bacterium]
MKQRLLGVTAYLIAAFIGLGVAPAQAQDSALKRIEDEKTLRVGWAVWHPYVFRNPKNNQLEGISYDLVNELGKAMNVKVQWVEDSWSTLPAGLQANKFEITNLMAITPPREKVVDFSAAVTQHGLSLIAPKDEVAKTKSWKEWDRPDVKIAVTLGANSDMFVTQQFKQAQIVRLKSVPENVLALVSGRVHAHASTIDALKSIQKEHPNLGIVPGSFGSSEVAFALPKGDAKLQGRVNKFIAEAKRNGRVTELLKKYGLDDSFAAD